MRTLLLALMIVLLPLRGWMGDAMAISMAGMQLGGGAMPHAMAMTTLARHSMAPQSGHATPQATHQDSGHKDCAGMPMMMAAALENAPDEAAGAMTGCESCALCQVCSSTLMGVHPLQTAALETPQASPRSAPAQFSSNHPQRGHKPPIS